MRRTSRRKAAGPLRRSYPLLAAVTSTPAYAERILTFPEIQGLLFVMVTAPDTVSPSEFLPIIFRSDEGVNLDFLPREISPNDLLQEVTGCYNDLVAQMHNHKLDVPPGYHRPDNIMKLFHDSNELHLWSVGFMNGFLFLEEDWGHFLNLDAAIDEEIGATSMVLSFFSDRSLANAYYNESRQEKTFEVFAQEMFELIPKAMSSYASIGWKIHHEISKPQ